MKIRKKDVLELAVYGLAALLSGALFFFGICYPDYLYTKETYRITADFDMEAEWGVSPEEFEALLEADKLRLIAETDPSRIHYKSKLWEMLCESSGN